MSLRSLQKVSTRIIAIMMCVLMMLSSAGMIWEPSAEDAYEADETAFFISDGNETDNGSGLCEHHPEHTAECGYAEALGHICTHVHDVFCGYNEGLKGVPCDHDCSTVDDEGNILHVEDCAFEPEVEPSPCTHEHDWICGFEPAAPCRHEHNEACGYSEGAPCAHEHNENCGYVEAVEAAPCRHEHNETCGYAEAREAAPCQHEHNENCGYVEAVEGTACGHEHDGACGYAEGTEEIPCDRDCVDEDGDGLVDHAADCAYTPASEGAPCQHEHDENCGYVEAVEGQPCRHEHDDECGYAEAREASPCRHEHDGDCGYAEAVEGQPCQHEHDGECGYAEAQPCGHGHDENCGYIAPAEGQPCEYVCEICALTVVEWTWDDPWEILLPAADYSWVEGVDWVLGLPGALEEDDLRALLPAAVHATLKNGETVDLPVTWDFENKQQVAILDGGSSFGGVQTMPLTAAAALPGDEADVTREAVTVLYLISAHLPEEYSLNEGVAEPAVLVQTMCILPLVIPMPEDLTPELLPGALHFIIRNWHTKEEASGEFDDGVQSDDWYFVVAEGYIVPTENVPAGIQKTEGAYQFYIVNQNTVRQDDESYESTDTVEESWHLGLLEDVDKGASPYIQNLNRNEGTIQLTVNLVDDNEKFAGYSVSAGHDAVTLGSSSLTIQYDEYVHLVKAHAFYMDNKSEVMGTNAQEAFGVEGRTEGLATRDTVYWDEATGQYSLQNNENGSLPKVYSTMEGLHTDKTAIAEDDGRTFNIELESWYTEGYAPQVALALDASGSMVIASDTVRPVTVDGTKITDLDIHPLTSDPNTDGHGWGYYFLNNDQLNQILNPHNTDNSPMSASGYSYFVPDNKGAYNPLGYWEGVINEPAAQFAFAKGPYESGVNDKRDWLLNSVTGGYATKVQQLDRAEDTFAFVELPINTDSSGTVDWPNEKQLSFSDKYGFGVGASSAGVLLDVKPGSRNFTLTFKTVYDGSESGTVNLCELLYVGPLSGNSDSRYLRVFRPAGSDRTYLRVANSGGDDYVISAGNAMAFGTSKTIALVFSQEPGRDDITVTVYVDGVEGGSGTVYLDDLNIVINGVVDSYSSGKIYIDDVALYNYAMTSTQVSAAVSGSSGTAPNVATTWAGELLGTINRTSSTNSTTVNKHVSAGWYYISHFGALSLLDDPGSAKRLQGINGESSTNASDKTFSYGGYTYVSAKDEPSRFFLDADGKLWCFYNTGNVSQVYELADGDYIRTEALQRAMGAFMTSLYAEASSARLSAVKFSENGVSDANLPKLVMLDWTSDPAEALGILSLKRGGGAAGGSTPSSNEYDYSLPQYNYGLTGSTDTSKGIEAYIKYLKAHDQDPYPNAQKGDVPKYLIIFTDGDDTGGLSAATPYIDELKKAGYVIYSVLLAQDASDTAFTFLTGVSGRENVSVDKDTGYGNDGKRYFFWTTVTTGVADELTKLFSEDILKEIVQPLDDFTIQDYIDPRFDLVDAYGTVWHLNNGGSVKNGSGELPITSDEVYRFPAYRSNHVQTDERNPFLCYDSERDMYYLRWTDQTIPTCTIGATRLTIWNERITIRAKDDFIGGNAVLSNGNEEKMNYVFSPQDANASSGTDDALVSADNLSPSKGFPRTSVCVEPPTEPVDEEQTIFMGEELKATDIAHMLIEAAKSKATNGAQYYWEYAERFCNFFGTYGQNAQVTRLVEKFHEMDWNGDPVAADAPDSPESGRIISDRLYKLITSGQLKKDKLAELLASPDSNYLYLPYIYLPDNADLRKATNSTGNSDEHLGDVIGYLYFEVQERYLEEDESESQYLAYPTKEDGYRTRDTETRKSRLTVTFVVQDSVSRRIWNNGQVIKDEDYKRDTTYKPTAGTEQQKEFVVDGSLTTYIVSGEVQLQLQLTEEQVEDLSGEQIQYVAKLMRRYEVTVEETVDGETVTRTETKEEQAGTLAVTATVKDGVLLYTSVFAPTGDYAAYAGYTGDNAYGLPLGKYTLVTDADNSVPPEGYIFKAITDVTVTSEYIEKTADGEDIFVKGSGLEEEGWQDKYLATLTANTATLADKAKATKDKLYTDFRFGLFRVEMEAVGDLEISKTVIGGSDHFNEQFTFTVTLILPDGVELPMDGYAYEGGVLNGVDGVTAPRGGHLFKGGTTDTVTLKHGQTILIKDLPAGTTYTVTETPVDGYETVQPRFPAEKASGGEEPGADPSEEEPNKKTDGIIGKNETDEADFVNKAVHSLTISKTVAGSVGLEEGTEIEWVFDITLTLPPGIEPPEEGYLLKGAVLANVEGAENVGKPADSRLVFTEKNGVYTYTGTITLIHGQSVTIEGLPCGTGYSVQEQDANEYGYGTTVGGERVGENPQTNRLTANTDLGYVNTNPYTAVNVTKTVVSDIKADEGEEFTFTVRMTLPAGEKVPTKGYRYSDGDGETQTMPVTQESGQTYTGTITLKHGQTATIYGLPPGTTVTVVETANGHYATLYDGSEACSPKSVKSEDEISFAVQNTRSAYDMKVAKTVSGNMGNREAVFPFTATFTDAQGNALETVKVKKADGTTEEIALENGSYSFELGHDGSIEFVDLPDGTQYEIEESGDAAKAYKTTVVINGDTQQTGKIVQGMVNTAGVDSKGNLTLEYINFINSGIPTDATSEYGWLLAMLVLMAMAGCAAAVGLFVKRRRSE